MDFKKYFPSQYKPNKNQEYILEELNKAWNLGKKYIIINAPTGSGKSIISKTIAQSAPDISATYRDFVDSGAIYDIEEDDVPDSLKEGTAILTVTKSLQDQYKKLFPEDTMLKGKSNYPCSMVPTLSSDLGPCVFEPEQKELCISCGQCEYFLKRDEALKHKCSFYSYSMFMSLPPACRAKRNIIADECAELEDLLVQSYTVPFNFKILKKLNIEIPPTPTQGSNYEKYILWLRSAKASIYSTLVEKRKEMRGKDLKKMSKEKKLVFRAINIFNDSCDKVLGIIDNNEFIIEHNKEELIFKPFKVDKIAQRLFKHCDLVVLMSATIIDYKNFAKQLGIKEDEYYYIESASTFDPKKAPIHLSNFLSVSYSNKALVIPQLCKIAKQICENYKGKKGIIHTHTFEITEAFKKAVGNNPRFLFREPGKTNEFLINEHIERNDDTILVSPSMTHGVDLCGALGEFAVILKAPFLPLGDERVKRLAQDDKEWYTNKMLGACIQMCGRTIRNASDEAVTYILDGTLTKSLIQNKDKLPKYFLERFV